MIVHGKKYKEMYINIIYPTVVYCKKEFKTITIVGRTARFATSYLVGREDKRTNIRIKLSSLERHIIKFRYNARADWLKQRALSEYRCTQTPDLFVRKMKLVLKIRVNVGGNKRILYHKTNKEASTVLCSVVKHLGSG